MQDTNPFVHRHRILDLKNHNFDPQYGKFGLDAPPKVFPLYFGFSELS